DDEENRRLAASELLEDYISSSFQNANVILLGDLNDELTDASNHNVFQPFISSSSDYQFTNLSIANGSSLNWSYPLWPSHLDHILITNELFASFNHPSSTVTTIKVDDYLPAGFSDYDNDISDHRPVGLKLYIDSNTLVVSNYDHLNQFMLYPNPATTSVSVLLKADISTVSLVVYNAFGQLVVNKNLVDKLDISELSSGLYFVQVFENNKPIGIQKLYIQQ
ncbi:MAG: T9SS type A sorting domain-containing protein, partial [Crocinitomicaceae bacterium]